MILRMLRVIMMMIAVSVFSETSAYVAHAVDISAISTTVTTNDAKSSKSQANSKSQHNTSAAKRKSDRSVEHEKHTRMQKHHVKKRYDINRGDMIKVLYVNGNLSLNLDGRAASNGNRDTLIKVRIISTGKLKQAKVIDNRTVIIKIDE